MHPDQIRQLRLQESSNTHPNLAILFIFIALAAVIVLLICLLSVILLLRYTRHGRILLKNTNPGELDDEALENEHIDEEGFSLLDDMGKERYLQAREFELNSMKSNVNTDAKLLDFLQVQEKGVLAWHFIPNQEYNCYVKNKTELSFLGNEECCMQTNLPLQRINEVYYFEVKLLDVPIDTLVSIGLATKPYPPFRLPGWNFWSTAYVSDGTRRSNSPFTGKPYSSFYQQGDVIGVGYKPKCNRIFFTRNGRRCAELPCTYRNLYPTVGAIGPCTLHVNLGQAGYVFIEANIKKWRLAPAVGSLAPPPSYSTSQPAISWDAASESSAGTTTQGDTNRPDKSKNRSPPINFDGTSYDAAGNVFSPSSSNNQAYQMHSMPATDEV
ncbi:SPRY domain-containing protein [Schizosaccharomyces pombe]